ncbi:membrane metallo-endopeptidase-like 1 [Rhipicephalus microplus]|uniref:membrane metallo-endopeptidase-like 1 n=1 Tax=Rhipicephalus microplus TaxID=6941 RepID=UPI003F6C4092
MAPTMIESGHPVDTPGSGQSPERRRHQRYRRIATLLLSTLAVSILLMVFVFLLTRSRVSQSISEPCRSPSCRRFMDLLEASMDTTRDPCQDFYAFVCSRWKPEAGGRTFLEDAMLALQDEVIERATSAKVPARIQNRFEKAVALYHSCLVVGEMATGSFREFLDSVMGSPWPEVNKRVDPIGILLDLSFQWRCPVLFYIFYAHIPSSTGQLTFLDSSVGLDFTTLFAEYKSRQDHSRYICALHVELNKGSDHTNGDRDSVNHTKWCNDLARFQSEVLTELEPHSHESNETSYANVYQFAAQVTPSISGRHWIRIVASHARQGETILSSTPVKVDKPAYLKTLTKILENKPRKEVLTFIGLTIVQVVGRFASTGLAALIYNAASVVGRKYQRTYCYHLVDVALPAALGNEYLFEDQRIHKVKEVADVVVASSIAGIRDATWFTAQFRDELFEKIGRAPLVFEGILREANATSENFPVESTYFLDNAKNLPNDVWALFKQRYNAEVNQTSVKWTDHPSYKLSIKERPLRLVVPDVYMSKSVFPDDAYESITYGTLGSLIARQVVSAVYFKGQTDDSGAQQRDDLTDGRSGNNGTLECLVDEFERRQNVTAATQAENDKFALYEAWASLALVFNAYRSSPGLAKCSAGYKGYSPVQLLFITLCFIGEYKPGLIINIIAAGCCFPYSWPIPHSGCESWKKVKRRTENHLDSSVPVTVKTK